jgi:hypothetical protein
VATNFFFNNFGSSDEQGLVEDLVIESIKIYGHDVYYLPRTEVNFDQIFGEDTVNQFKRAYNIEMYIRNVEGFEGEGDLMSRFGLEIRDQVTFTVAQRVFSNELGDYEAQVRPLEGDLIYFPLNNKIFEVKFVEHEAIFYQMGKLQTYDLKCELFEYSSERFDTDVAAIDKIEDLHSLDATVKALLTELEEQILLEDGTGLLPETFDPRDSDRYADNNYFQVESDKFVDFSDTDPFSERGVF